MDTVPHLITLLDPQPLAPGDVPTRLGWQVPALRDPQDGLTGEGYLIPARGVWEFTVWLDLPHAAGSRIRCTINVDGQVVGANSASVTGIAADAAGLQVVGADLLDVGQQVTAAAVHTHDNGPIVPLGGRLWGFWRSW